MRITKDGFVWHEVNGKAKEVFSSGLFELYILHDDECESLAESMEDINKAMENGLDIAIAVGHIKQ